MSLGSNAPRKPNVASASTTLYKASSRFLHSGEKIGPGKGVKRQRAAAAAASLDSTESNDNLSEVSRCFAVTELKGVKSKKRFVGVRQRPSGRWVAEIKDTTQKIRLWLGTFDSAEEGAKAYDSAARALRGANTRTNFVPAMACEGTAPASKAARLIRLRQMAAATKACEKEAARNVEPKRAADHPNFKVEPPPSPLVKQEFQQQSNNSVDPVEDHTSSKPARLMGRRHNAPAKSEQVQDVDVPPPADHCSVVDTGHLLKLEPPPKLEPQLSVTSENLSNAIPRSLGSPQESSSSPRPRRILSPRASFEGVIQSVTNLHVDATDHFNEERFAAHCSPPLESFGAVYDFKAPPLIPLHVASLDAGGYPHQINSPCATNRDLYGAAATLEKEHGEVSCPGRSSRVYRHPSSSDDDDAVDLDDEKHKKCVDTKTKCEAQDSSSMEYPSFDDMYDRAKAHEGCILSELVVPELAVPEIPWPEYNQYMLMDEMEMGSLGLDLSCETSGVYTTPFEFSTEAIDHDSCTSGVLPSKFYLMHHEQSSTSPPAGSQDFQECVLLTEIPELEDSPEPGPPPLSPPEAPPEQLWRLNDTTTTSWDEQSTDGKLLQSDSGESQDQEELWSSMDLAPLCMVA